MTLALKISFEGENKYCTFVKPSKVSVEDYGFFCSCVYLLKTTVLVLSFLIFSSLFGLQTFIEAFLIEV